MNDFFRKIPPIVIYIFVGFVTNFATTDTYAANRGGLMPSDEGHAEKDPSTSTVTSKIGRVAPPHRKSRLNQGSKIIGTWKWTGIVNSYLPDGDGVTRLPRGPECKFSYTIRKDQLEIRQRLSKGCDDKVSTFKFAINDDELTLKHTETGHLSTWIRQSDRSPSPLFPPLPENLAIISRNGTGEKRLVVLIDPLDSFYTRFESNDADKLDNTTIYRYFYPILKAESVGLATDIYCSKDPLGALKGWLYQKLAPPSADPNCRPDWGKVLDYGQKNGHNGTPTFIFQDGSIVPGYASIAFIRSHLDAAK